MTHELLPKPKKSSAARARTAAQPQAGPAPVSASLADLQLRQLARAAVKKERHEEERERRRAARSAPRRWADALLERVRRGLGMANPVREAGPLPGGEAGRMLALDDAQAADPAAAVRAGLLKAVAAQGGVEGYRAATEVRVAGWRTEARERDHDKGLLEYLPPGLQPRRARIARRRRKADVEHLGRLADQLTATLPQLDTLTDDEKDYVAGSSVAAAARQAVGAGTGLDLAGHSVEAVRAAERLLAKAAGATSGKAEAAQAVAVHGAVRDWLHEREARAFAASLTGLPEQELDAQVERLAGARDPLSRRLWETAVGSRAQHAAARSGDVQGFLLSHQDRLARKRAAMPLRVFHRDRESEKLKRLEAEALFLAGRDNLRTVFSLQYLLPFTGPHALETQQKLATELPDFLRARIADVHGFHPAEAERLEELLSRVEDEKRIRTVRDMIPSLGRDGANALFREEQAKRLAQAEEFERAVRKAEKARTRGGLLSLTSCFGGGVPDDEFDAFRKQGRDLAKQASGLAADYAAYERVLNTPAYAGRFAPAEHVHVWKDRLGVGN
ncbi:hypothetical protein ACMATS_03130 [Streptoverticillium reticulum]|uniref:hypothetical protein n=1 Tax=Streptoverticillium reticulum TaxID=1433415 RepID=UPI0039BFE604